jgi:hypothetical protein
LPHPVGNAPDAPLEQAGFELPVPLPRARLVGARRSCYPECIKLT